MTTERCADIEMLLQADHDGELDVAGTASLAAHLAQCPDCGARQVELARLSTRLRTELPYHRAPDRLRQAIAAAMPAQAPPRPGAALRRWRVPGWRWPDRLLPFGAGIAVAATLMLVVLPPRGDDLAGSVVASHIRALQPGHLMDVVSTDQHTVKPWFDGRLDYAPPVKDLAAQGFPLVGGRLDYLGGRPVAALAYRRNLHVIDLYVWPVSRAVAAPSASGEHSGYHYVGWTQDGMTFWAVSDVTAADLRNFVDRWRAAA
jgi:anti-sigma factor RsiW